MMPTVNMANRAINVIRTTMSDLYKGEAWAKLVQGLDDAVSLAEQNQMKEAFRSARSTAWNYLWTNASRAQKVARLGAAAYGIWAPLNTINRFRKGGGVLHDEYGRFDVVGIPFI
ncbi:hypothetical protein MTAT_20300 [Moorella thermoacetica]|uniref:Uncharacterized protein n=1 Tax=Neomoorella thermoacetica TaxID=1525 RepID=A0AAC9HIT8_NEOTH|nr:hypothetical protein [Moorella thermoacetica]AOQ24685.1 hypothetical protein Maut_02257 [Moorella thermoacetica]TYL12788.1 hypothetical protein MTAT_20300 [Moorella thermoacetica]